MDSFNMDEKHMFLKMLYSIIPLWWCHNVVCFSIYINTYIIRWFCDDEVMRWLCVSYTCIHICIMILWWWDVMRTQWWLHSTTGSYKRLVIEVAYGETLIHSTKAIWEILAQEECKHVLVRVGTVLTLIWSRHQSCCGGVIRHLKLDRKSVV